MTEISLSIAGATGWTGRAIVDGALAAPDITLTSAIARSSAGEDLGSALGREPLGVQVRDTVAEAVEGADVLVEFTSHAHAKEIALTAVERGVAVGRRGGHRGGRVRYSAAGLISTTTRQAWAKGQMLNAVGSSVRDAPAARPRCCLDALDGQAIRTLYRPGAELS